MHFFESKIFSRLLVIAALFLFAIAIQAQTSTGGTVSGQVVDQQGAAMPGVAIKLIDPATNITLTTKTNDAGRFLIANVNPGTYDIEFMKTGFATRKVRRQDVRVAEILTM